MSRCDQHMGLPEEAQRFLEENIIDCDVCPHCNRAYPRKQETCGTYTGMFNNEYKLRLYRLKNDMVGHEFVQADPWSSGPCFFLGLKVFGNGGLLKTFYWDQKVIDDA